MSNLRTVAGAGILVALSVSVLGDAARQPRPLMIAAGGDTCASPTVITSLPYNDTGDTSSAANQMLFLSTACAAGGAVTRPGRDVVYSITVFAGNSLTFQVTPDGSYDTAIYILGTCTSGASCSHAADAGGDGQAETIGPVTLTPGTHYFFVDSLYSEDEIGGFGPYTLSVTGTLGIPNNASFYTVTPCRVLDTREENGSWGGPVLTAGVPRTFQIAGRCLIPAEAKSISANLTITQPTAQGHLTVYPGGTPVPGTSTLNFSAGKTRANNAIVLLGGSGTVSVVSGQPPGNTVHFILDVTGYFQ